jgi:phosphoribosyl 1,2-cyclic phosphate phosphodiesterase
MSATVTVLGCGSSGGVPRVGNDWGACDPGNPRNRRRRCSILITKTDGRGTTNVLIDTSPDMREQMLSADVAFLDGVWFTHEHADHTHGIDELRGYYIRSRKRMPVWADQQTLTVLQHRFGYCFSSPVGSDYPPILDSRTLENFVSVEVDGAGGRLVGIPFPLVHGNITALGFRIGSFAYTPDLNDIPANSIHMLQDLDIWLVDALRMHSHSSHFSLPETLDWIERLKPKRAIITNMHLDLDYEKLCRTLPKGVEPAYDGMKIEIA